MANTNIKKKSAALSGQELPTLNIKAENIIFISDIHFGWASSSEEWQENQERYFNEWFIPYVQKTLAERPETVVVSLGDVYHDRKSIDIDVNELCIDTFERIANIIPCYIINGNHDLSKKTNKGNSSLRSLTNIKNLTVIKETTLMKFKSGTKVLASIAAIPYLGDCNDENKWLVEFSGKAEYALMHTDISKMKFDNGMTIVGAVDAEKFSGRVISGHIHKRQETPKVVYVGSPYQMSRGDIGNQKGIYLLTLEDGELIFTPNNFSPVFQKLDIKQFMNMTDVERREKLNGNYTDIVIDEADIPNYKMADIYELMNTSGAKRAQLEVKKSKIDVSDDEDGRSTDEKTVEELIDQAIESLEGVDEQTIAELKALSSQYLSAAREAEDKK